MGPLDLCTLLHTCDTSTKNLQRQLHRDWHISVFVNNSKVGQCTPLVRGCEERCSPGIAGRDATCPGLMESEFDAVTAWFVRSGIHMLKPSLPVPQNLTVSEIEPLNEAIKLK